MIFGKMPNEIIIIIIENLDFESFKKFRQLSRSLNIFCLEIAIIWKRSYFKHSKKIMTLYKFTKHNSIAICFILLNDKPKYIEDNILLTHLR